MRRRLVKELVDALEDSAHAGTAKNVYEAYVPHAERKRRHKEKKAEALLISLCTKLAFSLKPRIKPVTLPKIVPSTPPGISRNVGKLNPGVMTSKNMSPIISHFLSRLTIDTSCYLSNIILNIELV